MENIRRGRCACRNRCAFSIRTINADEGVDGLSQRQVETIVRQYILDHPEVLIESLNAYQNAREEEQLSQSRERAAERTSELASAEGGFAIGPSADEARLTVVEFFDYHCGYCKSVGDQIWNMVEDNPDVRFVFKEYPILSRESEMAATAVLAANELGKAYELHRAFMASKGRLNSDKIKQIAEQTGFDAATIDSARTSKAIELQIEATYRLAQEIGVNATPGFVVIAEDGVEVYAGANYVSRLRKIIRDGRIEG